MTRLFDTHCHLQDRAFAEGWRPVVERARAAGVTAMTLLGYDAASNVAALEMAGEGVFAAVGYHPHDAKELDESAFAALEAQAADDRVVAIGEIGLDFYRDLSPHDVQRDALDRQLGLAARLGKPVCLHSRSAEEAIEPHLQQYAAMSPLGAVGRPVGVMHCFAGTLEQALRYVDLGFVISVACTVTYPANEEGRRIAAGVPLDRLVIETDSPYLPPQAMRGKRNEPANVEAAARAIADCRGIAFEAVAEATTQNAERLFGVQVGTTAVPA
ncbi:MAG: TatD family hydrolase [Tepidiformaceae bacterium]